MAQKLPTQMFLLPLFTFSLCILLAFPGFAQTQKGAEIDGVSIPEIG